ncbi:MAG: DUF285 domain-containing protein, partial [Lachnospiraceae bacterium]|nr:DUF285 domain-containing protein [Lachnospiraceae bacterium]
MKKWKRCTALFLAAVMLFSLVTESLFMTASAQTVSDDNVSVTASGDSVSLTATATDAAETAAEETDAAPEADAEDGTDAVSGSEDETDAASEDENVDEDDPAADLDIAISTYTYMRDGTSALLTSAIADVSSVEETASAETEGMTAKIASTGGSSTWTFGNYYLNEDDNYDVTETNDFTLKYQFYYTTDEDRAAQTVEIRIPAVLYTDRNGVAKLPDDIGVPEGTPADYTYTSSSPFNYYLDTATNELVFWNYREITSGSRSTVQVLYKVEDIMYVKDGTTWSITPTISVTHENGTVDTGTGQTMTGLVDTGIELSAVVKSVYNDSSASYTPGLYTEAQVENYINTEIPSQYAGDNFDDYVFAVWTIYVGGDATQEWSLQIKDTPTATAADGVTQVSGTVVGYSWNNSTGTGRNETIYGVTYNTNGTVTISACTQTLLLVRLYVVTAYKKTDLGYDSSVHYDEDTNNKIVLSNTATVTMYADDGLDASQTKSDSADFTWVDYEWNYPQQYIGVNKYPVYDSPLTTYSAWLDIYRNNRAEGKDTSGISYYLISTCYGGIYTHNVTNAASTLGYKELIAMDSATYGDPLWSDTLTPYYEVTTVDDALYLYPDGDQSQYVILDEEDYYYSSVTVMQVDSGYDIFEDSESDVIEQCTNTFSNGEYVIDQGITIYAMYAKPDYSIIDTSKNYVMAGELYDVDNQYGTGTSTWSYVGHVDWDASGEMTYTFTDEQLAMEPYRVMVVHDSVNYLSECYIWVDVTLRADSPALAQCVTEDTTYIELENMAGVAGELFSYKRDSVNDEWEAVEWNGGTVKHAWFHDYDNSYDPVTNYSEPGIVDYTLGLYGMYLMRDGGWAELTSLTTHTESYKTSTLENDAANERVVITYTITAFEGYEISDQDTLDTLLSQGFDMDIRDEAVFYDLLPYGVNFNLSAGVTAGQIQNITTGNTLSGATDYTIDTSYWETTNISVTVGEDDIIANWNGTGRTMVVFHVKYTGADPRVLDTSNGLWYQGYGIQFEAYYDWESIEMVETEYNIAAYMPEAGDDTPLYGPYADAVAGNLSEGLVYPDDGTVPSVVGQDYSPFTVGDINGDGVTDIYNILYSRTLNPYDVSTSTSSDIQKLVRADSDVLSSFGKTAVVDLGGSYTYQVALNNTAGTMTNIVIYDILEKAYDTRAERDYEDVYAVFEDDKEAKGYWQGTFTGLNTSALDSLGISYTVYYNGSSDAVISEGASDGSGVITYPTDVLTEANGWYTAARWAELGYDLSDVKALAVDLGSYELQQGDSVSFEVHMEAPDTLQTYTYAFNNVSYYTHTVDSTGKVTEGTTPSNSTRVKLSDAGNIEILKKFGDADSVPSALKNTSFTFTLATTEYRYTEKLDANGDPVVDGEGKTVYVAEAYEAPFANQLYTLYEYDSVTGEWVASGMVSSTDANGRLTLKAGQKAVFSDVADYKNVTVTEEESSLWKQDAEKEEKTETVTTDAQTGETETVYTWIYTFTNTYRSPVYLYKTTRMTEYADADDAVKIADAEFKFLVEVWDETVEVTTVDAATGNTVTTYGAYVPYANKTYSLVDKVLTDGTSPTILGTGATDANGYLTIGADDIAAVYLGEVGTAYRITEVNIDETLWVCNEAMVTGTSAVYGTSNTITNIYKNRTLYLTKTVEGYDGDLATLDATWTFKITRIVGIDEKTGNEILEDFNGSWYMVDSSGNKLTEAGTSGEIKDGVFSFTGAGSDRRVVIEDLTAGQQYRVQEISISYTDEKGDTHTFNFADKTSANYVPDGFIFDFGGDEEFEVTMPLYVASFSSGITNEYLLRDLSVSKEVVTAQSSAGGTSYLDAEFTFLLEKYVGTGTAADAASSTDPADWEAVTAQAYLLNGSAADGAGNAYQTDADGKFLLKSGEKAFFDDIGFEGDIYRITEIVDQNAEYKLVYPSDGYDILVLQEEDQESLFINGSAGLIVIEKDLEGLDDVGKAFVKLLEADNDELLLDSGEDSTIAGEDDGSGTAAVSTETAYAIDVKITVTDEYGNAVTNGSYTLYYINDAGEFVQTFSFSGSITSELKPGDQLVVAGVPKGYTVTAKETDEWERKLLTLSQYAAGEIGATDVLTEWGTETGSSTVTDDNVGIITLVNNISTANNESEIYKTMSENSTDVATGSVITFRVQVYNAGSGTWSPASGLRYITMDDSGATSGVLTTGSDGLIQLTKTDNGYPSIRFVDDIVRTNVYEGMADGDLRIIEESSLTDSAWGWLWGYGINRVTDQNEDTIINANDSDYSFEVAKVMTDGSTGDSFTFQIQHVLSANENPITEASQILESEAGAGLSYTLYSISTGKKVGTGTTDSNGEFELEAGQYAVFNVPTGTIWTIRELVTAGALLDSVEVSSSGDTTVTVLTGEDTAIIQETYDNSYMLSNEKWWRVISDNNWTSIYRIYFGKTSDYADKIDGLTAYHVGENDDDLIYLYKPTGVSEIYILADDQKIAFQEDCSYMFYQYVTYYSSARRNNTNLRLVVFDNINTSYVTNMSGMFYYCGSSAYGLTLENFEVFDTGSVTDMSRMFYYSHVKELDLSGFDTA